MSYRLLLLLAVSSAGTFTLASDPPAPANLGPTTNVSGTVGLNIVDGVTDSQTYNLLGSLDRINPGIDTIHFDGGYFFSRQTQPGSNHFDIASNFAFTNGRYDRNISGKLAVYGALGYRVDNPNNLKLRSLYGAGLAYQVVQKKALSWNLSGGAAYLIENYTDGSQSAYKPSAAFGSQLNWTIGSKIVLTHTLGFTPALSNFSNYVATSVFSFGYQLSKPLKLSINNVVDYQSEPPVGTLKKNSQWFVGLTYGGKA